MAVLVLLAGPRVTAAVDVTECGQVITPGQVAELKNDLTCAAGQTEFGVFLKPGSRLRMNGFRISGDGTGAGILCGDGRCTIEGPGEIHGFFAGVNCGACRVVVRDVVVRENLEGIYVPLHGTLVADGVVASDNARSGIWAQRIRGTDIEASRNGQNGVSANGSVRIRRLEATANGRAGFLAGSPRSRLVDSAVADNDVAGDGFDIVATGTVRLVRTRCGKSAKLRNWSQGEYDVVGSFGCTND